MMLFGIAAIFIVMLAWQAVRANARFRDRERLPMQWWLTGEVTWSAPRVLALAFVPLLGASALIAYAFATRIEAPRVGQESLVLPIFVGLGVTFVAIQLLHLRLIAWSLRRG